MADEQELTSKRLATTSKKDDGNTKHTGQENERKNFVIGIGISKYANAGLNTLGDACKNDCEDLMQILQSDFGFETVKGWYDDYDNKVRDGELKLINEEATRKNIDQLFESLNYHPDFMVDSKNAGLTTHNLVIYYSGHGAMVGNNMDFFHFVPSDYKGPLDNPSANKLYSVNNGLFYQLNNIRFHSIVIIIDACHSAGAFNQSNWFSKSLKGHTGTGQSLWALCSSAEDQKSYWVTGSKHSLFTQHLLEELTQLREIDINLELLRIKLNKRVTELNLNVFLERLYLIEDNTGDFNFIASETRRTKFEINNRKTELKKAVYRINYIDLRTYKWKIFPTGKNSPQTNPHLLLLSTGPGYGLKIVHRLIYMEAFPPNKKIPYKPSPLVLHKVHNLKPDKQSVLNIINHIVEGANGAVPASTITFTQEALNTKLLKKLKVNPVIVELLIDHEKIDPNIKDAFMKTLHELLAEMDFTEEGLQPFCVLVLDADGWNYEERSTLYTTGAIQRYIMPLVKQLDNDAIDDWQRDVRRGQEEEAVQRYYDLLENIIDSVVNETFENGKCPPGKFIEELCKKSGCQELAIEILNY
jgi:hypothetical protein